MTAIQFDAEIREGILTLPPELKDAALEGLVHVILMKSKIEPEGDFITELLAAPAEISDFVPLTRNQAHER
jgi:hypothetical protein